MKRVWAVADCVVSPLGDSSSENFANISQGFSGLKPLPPLQAGQDRIVAGAMDDLSANGYTTFESLCMRALSGLAENASVPLEECTLVLSTTKGNIELLDNSGAKPQRLHLHEVAEFLGERFRFKKRIVVSNACVSGVLAVIVGKRLIENGISQHVVVLGADVLTKFVLSGFQSLLALSNEPCRPFDEHRRGINLGEGAGALLLTSDPDQFAGALPILVAGSGSTNDANHISGPSRTGEELALAINEALAASNITADDVDFISAHGTATLYNDEMEAKAFNIAGLSETPVHSLKGYYGHTLGAAGVIETIMGIHALRNGILPGCLGFSSLGVSLPLNINAEKTTGEYKTFLKTSSGFGGCNAALVLRRN